jgi:hypothetical protein
MEDVAIEVEAYKQRGCPHGNGVPHKTFTMYNPLRPDQDKPTEVRLRSEQIYEGKLMWRQLQTKTCYYYTSTSKPAVTTFYYFVMSHYILILWIQIICNSLRAPSGTYTQKTVLQGARTKHLRYRSYNILNNLLIQDSTKKESKYSQTGTHSTSSPL